MAFVPGELWVYPGQGLSRVVGTQDVAGKRFLMLELVDRQMRVGLPVELAESTLVRPMPTGEAEAVLARLKRDDGEGDGRSAPYRIRDANRTLSRGPASARVEALHTLYRSPFAPTFDERKLIEAYEDAVLPELASSLAVTPDSLRAQLHAIHPVFRKDAPPRPEEPPAEPSRPAPPFEIPGFVYLGDFTVERGELVVGEPGATLWAEQPPEVTERHGFRLPVLQGHWLAFRREEDGMPVGLVAVHEAHGGRVLTLLHSARERAKVIIEGGRVAILDAATWGDADIADELEFPLFADALIKERGATSSTGRDGVFPVKTAKVDGDTVLVTVAFDER